MYQAEAAVAREDQLPSDVDTERAQTEALIERIATDAREDPEAYLHQTISPGGGE